MPVKARAGGQGRVRGKRAGAQQGTGGTPSSPAPDPSFASSTGSNVATVVGSWTTGGSLPTGALGAWNFDQYSATPSPYVPNALVATAVSANLLRAPRRMFSNTEWWGHAGSVGTAFVDEVTTGPDGIGDASSLAGVGNWTLYSMSNYNVPAGTYTVACSVKRNAGSDQTFAFTQDNTGTLSSAKTATATWSRQSYTFTTGFPLRTGGIAMCSVDGATNANLYIRDFELFAGSSDLGTLVPDSHLYLGLSANDPRPVASTGAVDMSSIGFGLIQFPTATTVTNYTAQAVISKVGAGTSYQGYLSRVQNYGQFSALLEQSGRPAYAGGALMQPQQGTGLWTFLSRGYHLITSVYDGTNVIIYLDDIPLFVTAASLSSFSFRDLFVNLVQTVDLTGGLKYHSIAFWNRALSKSEVVSSFSYWQGHAASSSITLNGDTTDRIVIFEGDSRTSRLTGFPYIFGGNASPTVFGNNISISGSALTDLVARQTTVRDIIPSSKNGRKFYVIIGPMGANDLAGYTGATDSAAAQNYANALASISDTYYSYGADKVIVSTELAQSGQATHNTRRGLLNTILKTSWPGTNPVSVADIASDATMGTDTSFTDHPGDWDDGTHPNDAGHALLEPYYRTILNGLP